MKHFLLLLAVSLSLFSCTPSQPASHLDQILEKKVLRVGTTFDYPPFTYKDENGKPQGIDVELAQDLANSLEVKIEFVQTTWSDLLKDLGEDRFDIAMGGISKKLFRQQQFFFSQGYGADGKTGIAHCDHAKDFQNFSAADQPQVKVITNIGGTNERFAKSHLKKAKLITIKDNTKVFNELIQKNADIMFTDAIEVRYQSHLHNELCPTFLDQQFDIVAKAYLMPRDGVWLEYIDAWLDELKLQKRIDAAYAKYVGH